ncbi:alanine racemase [Actinoplanes sp. L3-i22]|uniref:alanine racemase n=1 Tax=Actinoplanes sp. L3-i22 TaxID=2836373 RepID=UPI001C8455BC|nr:alanine racemase [Actinoplanes sp. L3-i22]
MAETFLSAPARAARPLLTIESGAIADNVATVRSRTTAEVMAVVKADGFGHGIVETARTALRAGATWLGVTSLAEAFVLRRAGFTAPILSWLNAPGADFTAAASAGVHVAVPDRTTLAAVAGLDRGLSVHLHVDTGMSRGGADHNQWAGLCAAARDAERSGRIRVAGVMSHLGRADEPEAADNAASVARFRDAVAVARHAGLRPAVRHLAATAATLTNPAAHFDLVRIGAGLVGIDPSGRTRLRAAMTLTAPLIHVRHVAAGTPVGYRHTWHAPAATTLGLLPLGYADGLPRSASDRAQVLVEGRRCPVAGLISMDQTVLDLGGAEVPAGRQVIVLGPGDQGEPTVADWAGWAGTIEQEIVTRIGRRVARRVVDHEQTREELA